MYYRFEVTKCRFNQYLCHQCRWMSRLEASQTLKIEEHASKKEIKDAYIKLAKVYHPDSKVKISLLLFKVKNINAMSYPALEWM